LSYWTSAFIFWSWNRQIENPNTTLFDQLTLNDEPQSHPLCVLDFGSSSWNIYEKCINIFHFVMPFVLNLISIIGFILHKTKFEFTSTTKWNTDGRFIVIKKQLLKYKSLIISPAVILILEIPRFVLTFTLACIDHAWNRYYFISPIHRSIIYLHFTVTKI
jgi:hypothetical protein